MKSDFLVHIRCMTYNHAPFIEDAMNGFCMQQTTFPYLAVICDDASKDYEAKVIQNYIQSHFNLSLESGYQNWENNEAYFFFAQHLHNGNCHFLIVLLKENYYSRQKDKSHLWREWTNSSKYIAICEGDDYWTDPFKLQKQVGFLEKHPDYTMVCNRVKLFSVKKNKIVGEDYCYTKDTTINVKDVIYKTGLFISTCSIVYRKTIIKNYPDYCRKCSVGDYPLQIMAAMKGKIYYFNTPMSVYRMDNSNSWMGKQKWNAADEKRIRIIKSRIAMLSGFSRDYPQYQKFFNNKIADEIRRNIPWPLSNKKEYKTFISEFNTEISQLSLFWKIDYLLRTTKIPIIKWYYFKSKPLFSRFYIKRLYYK